MPKEDKKSALVVDFDGLYLNADPLDLPAGAARDQVNVQSRVPGELRARGGYRVVSFEV